MNYLNNYRILFPALLLVSLQLGMSPVSADVQEECQQEAQDYGLVAEAADDYIRDCLYSRGGVIPGGMIPEGDFDPYAVSDEPPSGEEGLPSP
ncbi:MAG: hypothetical protein EP297_08280 [Gammaproteobacteria bacterium]|nr:MAG: hypothetical protein EP297_08280 [Gammaproteobacteria bacterium]